jgi:hypothetical protein
MNRDPPLCRRGAARFFQRPDHAIATRLVYVPDIDAQSHSRGDAIDGAGKHIADSDGRDRVDGPARPGEGLQSQNQLGSRTQRVAAMGHQHCSGVSALTLDDHAQACRRRNLFHHAQRLSFALQQRPLFDVQFHEGLVIALGQSHLLQLTGKSGAAADLFYAGSLIIRESSCRLRRKSPRQHATAQAADAKARWFFGGEDEQFNRPPRLKSRPLQRPNGFQTAEYPHDPIVLAGIRNRVDMRPRPYGWCVPVTAHPASEGITDRVVPDHEAGVFAALLDPRTRLPFRRAEYDARHRRRFSIGEGG